jgi:RNA polymerase sigma factor for flagellar operon FliA
MSLGDFQHLLGDLRGLDLGSLQATSAEYGDGEELWQCRPDGDGNNPFYLCLHSEMNALLAKVIEELPERERQVLTLYHFEELTMKEVGALLGIGESRVSQVHTEALLRLRSRLQVEFESRAATATPQSLAASAKAKTWKKS